MTISAGFLATATAFLAVAGAVGMWHLIGGEPQPTWVKFVALTGAGCLLAAIWSAVTL